MNEATAKKLQGFEFSEILHGSGTRIVVIECKECETSYAIPDGKHSKMLTLLIVSIHGH